MEFRIVKQFYSDIEANIYYSKFQEAGMNCFLSSENFSTILPLSNGGITLHIAEDQLNDAIRLITTIELEQKQAIDEEDFKNATIEDINYSKKLAEHEDWLNKGKIDNNRVSIIMVSLFIVVVLGIILNYFYPFST